MAAAIAVCCLGVLGICSARRGAEVRGKLSMLDAKAAGMHASAEQVRKAPAKSDLPRTATCKGR